MRASSGGAGNWEPTRRSRGSDVVSLRCLLERDLGAVVGGSKNSLSSWRVFTLQDTSPTNASASFAVMALENPRPWTHVGVFSNIYIKFLKCFKIKISQFYFHTGNWNGSKAIWTQTAQRSITSHRDNDHAVLRDDFVGEFVECGVWVVIKRFELLYQVVQLDESSEGLALVRSVHGRREEVQHGVVLAVSLLTILETHEKMRHNEIQMDVFSHTNTHAVKKRGPLAGAALCINQAEQPVPVLMQLLNENELDFSPHSPLLLSEWEFTHSTLTAIFKNAAQTIRHVPIKQPYIFNTFKKRMIFTLGDFFFFLQPCVCVLEGCGKKSAKNTFFCARKRASNLRCYVYRSAWINCLPQQITESRMWAREISQWLI